MYIKFLNLTKLEVKQIRLKFNRKFRMQLQIMLPFKQFHHLIFITITLHDYFEK